MTKIHENDAQRTLTRVVSALNHKFPTLPETCQLSVCIDFRNGQSHLVRVSHKRPNPGPTEMVNGKTIAAMLVEMRRSLVDEIVQLDNDVHGRLTQQIQLEGGKHQLGEIAFDTTCDISS